MRPIATACCRRRWRAFARAAGPRGGLPTSSSSATRRSMSRARGGGRAVDRRGDRRLTTSEQLRGSGADIVFAGFERSRDALLKLLRARPDRAGATVLANASGRAGEMWSAFDQADVAGARTFLGIFRSELDALAFAQQLEHRAADRAAVEEVFDPAFVADEPEPLVDEEPCDCPGWHTRSPPFRTPEEYPKGTQPVRAPAKKTKPSGRGPAESFQLQLSWKIAASLGSSVAGSQARGRPLAECRAALHLPRFLVVVVLVVFLVFVVARSSSSIVLVLVGSSSTSSSRSKRSIGGSTACVVCRRLGRRLRFSRFGGG